MGSIYSKLKEYCADEEVIDYALSLIGCSGSIPVDQVVDLHRSKLKRSGKRGLPKTDKANTMQMVAIAQEYYRERLSIDDEEAYHTYRQWRRMDCSLSQFPSEINWTIWLLENTKEEEYNTPQFLRRLRKIEDFNGQQKGSKADRSAAESYWRNFRMAGWTWTSARRDKIFRKRMDFHPGGNDKNIIPSGAFEMNRRRH